MSTRERHDPDATFALPQPTRRDSTEQRPYPVSGNRLLPAHGSFLPAQMAPLSRNQTTPTVVSQVATSRRGLPEKAWARTGPAMFDFSARQRIGQPNPSYLDLLD